MGTISEALQRLSEKGERALVLFVTAGDPDIHDLPSILLALQEGGADIIEVGIPFSDPIADGPSIQASSQRALNRAVTPRGVLETIGRVKLEIPIIAMGYYNPILQYGLDAFAAAAVASGISGTIVSDLTPEEAAEWIAVSRDHGLANILLAAPTSTDERLRLIGSQATGFVYAVSRTGVTGAGSQAPPDVRQLVERIRTYTQIPVCVGFGISQPEHVRMVCEFADGAVIGSSLVDWLAENWKGGAGRDELIRRVQNLKNATLP